MPLSGLRYRSSARLHDSTRFPSRALRRITLTVLRTSGLLLLLLFIAASVLASLSDLALQFITSGRASLISDVSITFGSYVFVVVVGLTIIFWRLVVGRAALSVIPKGYVPTQSTDVPKKVYELISNEYDRAALIAHVSQPKGRIQDGWGRPGTAYENVHFRSAILATIPMLRTVLAPLYPRGLEQPRSGPLSPIEPLRTLQPSPVPEALGPLAELYEQHLTRAKYGELEPTEDDYAEVVKVVAVAVGVVGGQALEGNAQRAENGADKRQ